jgi:hypothetical protein
MGPMSAIASGLSATKTGFDLIKGVRELLKRPDIDTSEVLARLTELQDLMLNAKLALMDADQENQKLNSRIAELARMADFGKDFKPAHGVYWHSSNAYCPICWDVDRKPVRLAGPVRNGASGRGDYDQWTCPFHKAVYLTIWNAKPPE